MAFDPSKFGAIPTDQKTTGFNPADFGAIPVEQKQEKSTSFGGRLLRGALRPFAKTAVSLQNFGENLAGKPITEQAQGPLAKYIEQDNKGAVTRVGANFDPSQGFTPENITAIKEAAGTGAELATNFTGGGAAFDVVKLGLKGALRQALKQGIKQGAVVGGAQGFGTALENDEGLLNTIVDTALGSLTGAVFGGATAGISGGAQTLKAAKKGVQALTPESSSIMNRVARLTPTDANKFQNIAGMSHGEYLTKTGNFGTPQEIVQNESRKFVRSLNAVDDAMAQLPGTYKNDSLGTALQELADKEMRVSAPGAPSASLNRVNSLISKYDKDGLTMAEINEVKRLFERNVKLGYSKLINPESVQRATNIDNALRNWQLETARGLGLKNLDELNKQTQISKQLINSLGKQITGKSGNDAVSLTDWIMLSHGNPEAVAGFLTKKIFSSKGVQSGIAKILSKSTPLAEKTAIVEPTAESIFRKVSPTGAKLLGPGKGTVQSQNFVPIRSMGESTIEAPAKIIRRQ